MTSYDHQALWTKAKLFIGRAMVSPELRDFPERAFWASTALELLAKSSLSRHSPLLIATPSEEGESLLIAAGLVKSDKTSFKSIEAKTLWKRCERAFNPFNGGEAALISLNRNEYVHGGGIGFDMIPESQWWPRFWAQAVILVEALDKDIDDLVGGAGQGVVEAHLATRKQHIQELYKGRVERARQRIALLAAGTLTATQERELSNKSLPLWSTRYSTRVSCPACDADGQIQGDEVIERQVEWPAQPTTDNWGEGYDPSFYDVVPEVTLWIAVDVFSCENCHLILDSYELCAEAGLEDTFAVEGFLEDVDFEPDYGND